MIQVEKKISLKEVDLKTIERLGAFLGSRILTDTYYDTPEFRYTTSDIWLRERECQFELKVGIKGLDGKIDRYEETSDEREILSKLGLEKEKDFLKALSREKIFPYATFQTARRKYQIAPFTIDLDLAYFDDFIYRSAEIEIFVENESEVPKAEQAIENFVQKIGFDKNKPVKAKLLEFLLQKNPTHYEALIASGVTE